MEEVVEPDDPSAPGEEWWGCGPAGCAPCASRPPAVLASSPEPVRPPGANKRSHQEFKWGHNGLEEVHVPHRGHPGDRPAPAPSLPALGRAHRTAAAETPKRVPRPVSEPAEKVSTGVPELIDA